jgi:hypothetical protein
MVARRCCSAAASSSQPAWLELGRLPRGRGLCPGNRHVRRIARRGAAARPRLHPRNLPGWSWVACRAGAGFAPATATFGVLPGAARTVGDLVRRATERCLPPRR